MPTAERPLRVAEFDELFATAVREVRREDQVRLVLDLSPRPEVAAKAADLVVRETGCCSFFTFGLTATGGSLQLEIRVPGQHTDVLEALAARAGEVATAELPRGTFVINTVGCLLIGVLMVLITEVCWLGAGEEADCLSEAVIG